MYEALGPAKSAVRDALQAAAALLAPHQLRAAQVVQCSGAPMSRPELGAALHRGASQTLLQTCCSREQAGLMLKYAPPSLLTDLKIFITFTAVGLEFQRHCISPVK